MSGRDDPRTSLTARLPADVTVDAVGVDPRPRIALHIERLVLDDLLVRSIDGPLVQRAIEAELARLLADGTLGVALRSGGSLASLPAVSLSQPAPNDPSDLGTAVAKAVHQRLGS